MRLIVEACTKWKWMKKLRMHQVDTYYWAVRYKGDSFYKGIKREFDQKYLLELVTEYANDPNNKEYQFV